MNNIQEYLIKTLKENKKLSKENQKKAERNHNLMIHILTISIINFLLIIGKLIIG